MEDRKLNVINCSPLLRREIIEEMEEKSEMRNTAQYRNKSWIKWTWVSIRTIIWFHNKRNMKIDAGVEYKERFIYNALSRKPRKSSIGSAQRTDSAFCDLQNINWSYEFIK